MMLNSSVITISYLAPPTARRKLLGDLAYLRIQLSEGEDLFVTAIPSGFYVNKSTPTHLDPTPVDKPCLEHALLDCLVQASPKYFAVKWTEALAAVQKRVKLTVGDTPLQALHRVAIQKSRSSRGVDAVLYRPSWMVPAASSWPSPSEHAPLPLEQDYPTFGLDLTSGVSRDWNEELQSAREMPVANIQERLERAR
jgi:protein TIF31